ncbi:hypothetical protein JMJ77_0008937 [Colletotrichum scovillei]|uniref:Uncharacterized protein n=1 Tax=Colletotrichum scovillei TaxID=1209932 RepID=A0A9P7QS57_9PEZI|nr:hypothetical protein JMJ78_0001794 [Colletotrichum scovillei]KAG7041234.1 hypothetical protein JMJ77_0008937 [Colletotrichum scovillei]KAG7061266.1 hypothetical protein JMJ76_0010334 [Colletotrichum scovillei]
MFIRHEAHWLTNTPSTQESLAHNQSQRKKLFWATRDPPTSNLAAQHHQLRKQATSSHPRVSRLREGGYALPYDAIPGILHSKSRLAPLSAVLAADERSRNNSRWIRSGERCIMHPVVIDNRRKRQTHVHNRRTKTRGMVGRGWFPRKVW